MQGFAHLSASPVQNFQFYSIILQSELRFSSFVLYQKHMEHICSAVTLISSHPPSPLAIFLSYLSLTLLPISESLGGSREKPVTC